MSIRYTGIMLPQWVRKLTGKPAFLTIADSESETPRIHLTDYEDVLPPEAAESKACRIQSGRANQF